MIENLNLMTRRELIDTMKHLKGEAFMQMKELLRGEPHVSGIDANLDLFLITLDASTISDISYSLESYTWDLAEVYAQKVEAQANTQEDDENHLYWQALHEKWGYLEMASDT
ncbi:MAG: hypothetical protein JJ934_12700 [Pseudomonadales bacterium]|nr:hypothetical protein [Pseudomonadales bacterium]MBO6597592.1 hypothetical protein [Pseudomonadales bacterium]MBO6657751.1 hypothetical protein [Pseudomonadales bacterium]MBO6704212.1 hypothetical protein [Pseudomonadales bacterium]MBO6824358.1 hypothetical protein [Pseudomonadales bacterium]